MYRNSVISQTARRVAYLSFVFALVLLSLPTSAVADGPLSGSWTKKSYSVAGTWTIDTTARTITLSKDFKTKNAPDLKIFLSPLSARDVANGTATEGSILVAPLDSNKGTQTYSIPANVDLSKFRSVLIHCERYTKLWAASDLHSP